MQSRQTDRQRLNCAELFNKNTQSFNSQIKCKKKSGDKEVETLDTRKKRKFKNRGFVS